MEFAPLRRKCIPLLCSAALLSGCMSSIPQDGPSGEDVAKRAVSTMVATRSTRDLPYSFIPVTSSTLTFLHTAPLPDGFRVGATSSGHGGRIGVGDVLDVSIFEAESGGLFTATPSDSRMGNAITLPSQEVGRDGLIVIPYAGRVRAAGTTAQELASLIASRLKTQALDPQVVVGFASRHSGSVNVLGEVYSATPFCLDAGGERLLGALARAG